MCITLGNGFKYDAKIDKNTNRKQIKFHFFSFYPQIRQKSL